MKPHALPRLAVAAFGALLAACGGTSAPLTPSTGAATQSASTSSPDALDARLAELTTRLRRSGVALSGTPTRGFLAGGESATVRVVAPAGSCATITTLASAGVRDLDATLFAPSGEVLAEDVAEDAHPTVQLCAAANEARRGYVVVRAYSGAGAYFVATFVGPQAALAPVAVAIGGTPGLASNSVTEVADDARLRDHTLGASRRGFSARGEPRRVPLATGQTVWIPLPVSAAECVSVLALAERGLEDVDAQLLDADGTEITRDVGTGRDASVQHCAERAAELVLVLTAKRGQGSARVAVFAGPVTRVGGASGLWLGQPAADRTATRTVDASLADARARATAANFAVRGRPLRTTVGRGGAERTSARLAANTCTRFELSAGPGIARPYLLVSVDGAPLTEHESRGEAQPAIAHVCTRAALDVDLAIVARSGNGELALTTATRPLLAPTDAAAHVEALRLDEVARSAAAGFETLPTNSVAGRESGLLRVAVPPGMCARIVFIADDAARVALEARVAVESHVDEHVLAADTAESPRVAFCATQDQPRTVEIRTHAATGSEELQGAWLLSRRRARVRVSAQ